MGTRNRERRRAKQKTRQQRQRGPRYEDGTVPPFAVGPPDAEELLGTAVHLAQCDGHADDELPACLDELAVIGAADKVAVTRLQRAVTGCWRRGWQPADLARLVRRVAGERQVRMAVDAIAAEMRGYARATVDDRWAGQLTELDAAAWWDRDDRFLTEWASRQGATRVETVGCAVEVVALLETLPELPVLAPPPGTARRGSGATGPGGPVDERALERVRALLAKAESTTFPEEAETYTAKAQELMARHRIDQALLAAGAPAPDQPAGRRLGVENPYEQPKALLLEQVAAANRCRAVWSRQLGFATVLGFAADLDAVELLYTSLLVQATAAMLREGSRRDRSGRSRTRSFRQSFLTAYATRIGERLSRADEDATRAAAAEPGRSDLLPVLAARDQEVDQTLTELFPGMVTHAVRVRDGEGWASGRAAADRARLGVRDQVSGGSR